MFSGWAVVIDLLGVVRQPTGASELQLSGQQQRYFFASWAIRISLLRAKSTLVWEWQPNEELAIHDRILLVLNQVDQVDERRSRNAK